MWKTDWKCLFTENPAQALVTIDFHYLEKCSLDICVPQKRVIKVLKVLSKLVSDKLSLTNVCPFFLDYPAGLTSVIFFVSGLGEINLSMFNSTNLTSVHSLTMAHQGVTAIEPQTFDKFQSLKTLSLHDNLLSQVSSDWFSHHAALETLRLSNNKITTLDHRSLDGLSNLLMLDLSQNQIHTIAQSSFLSLRKLRQLDLSNNQLTHLSADLFLPLNGTKIRLDGNPWDCSCSVKDFAKYLRGIL